MNTLLLALLLAPDSVQTLMDLDTRFCQDFTENGAEGWIRHFADNAVLYRPDGPFTRSKAELAAHYRRLFGKGPGGLTWKPAGGEIAKSGDLGFTYGTYAIKPVDGAKPRTGKYLTVWQKQKDGSWKIVADTGSPDVP